MCSEACRAGLRFLFVPLVFVLRDNIRYVITAGQLCQQLFYFLLGTDLRKTLFPAVPRENLLLLCCCFSAAKCIVPLRPGLCKHFFQVFYFRSFCAEDPIYLSIQAPFSEPDPPGPAPVLHAFSMHFCHFCFLSQLLRFRIRALRSFAGSFFRIIVHKTGCLFLLVPLQLFGDLSGQFFFQRFGSALQ